MEKGSLKPGFLRLELVAVASTWQGFSLFIDHSFQGNLKKKLYYFETDYFSCLKKKRQNYKNPTERILLDASI